MIAALFYDMQSLPARESVSVERDISTDVSVASKNEGKLKVRVRAEGPVYLQVVETAPQHSKISPDTQAGVAEPGRTAVFSYSLVPYQRGQFTIGPVYLRAIGKWGLAERKMCIENEQEIRVIPDLSAARRHDLRLRRGLMRRQGNRTLRIRGHGDEFESLRQYVPDDDPRWIDWRSTARRGKMLTKQFQPESRQRIIMAVDLGRLMLGKKGDFSKLDAVLNSCILLAHAAVRAGDSVGFIAFGSELQGKAPAATGRRQVRNILSQIAPLNAAPVETDFRILLRELGTLERRRALVVLFTDFIDESQIEELQSVLLQLRKKHRVLVAAVRDAELFEMSLAAASDEKEAFAVAAASHLLSLRRRALANMQAAGVMAVDLNQDELAPGVVERYLAMREQAIL